MKPLSLLIGILIILGVTIKTIKAEEHNKRQKERNVTTQVSVNEIKQYLSHILEQRTSSNVINKRENLLEKKKNQRKIRIKGFQNKDILKRNKNHLQKQAEKNFTDEGDQLFKMGIKVLQQSKSQKQKEEILMPTWMFLCLRSFLPGLLCSSFCPRAAYFSLSMDGLYIKSLPTFCQSS
ncbi:SEL1L2 isoform 5 [Pan troglodytes]|uniref:SEL1L2 isoform 5 n=1 Tax=Pan troglodytes TaxID=9598 RepID=A0A2J8MSV8_PANTR|nr:SEL1L2 isoform 5 [Pan troglodytes]